MGWNQNRKFKDYNNIHNNNNNHNSEINRNSNSEHNSSKNNNNNNNSENSKHEKEWIAKCTIVPSYKEDIDYRFGISVTISNNNVLVIGTAGKLGGIGGTVYVYSKRNSWTNDKVVEEKEKEFSKKEEETKVYSREELKEKELLDDIQNNNNDKNENNENNENDNVLE